MKTSTAIWIIVVIIVVLGVGWYWYARSGANVPTTATSTTTASTTAQTSSSSQGTTPVVGLGASATLGSYLTAENGMTLYTYSPDSPGVSNCTGQCAVNWPPYTVPAGSLTAASGITGSLATIMRADGTMQLTYNGKPLYFYVKDSKPGDTAGQGVGGVWFVSTP